MSNSPAVLAFASVQSGAGASYVVRGLSSALTRSGKSVAVCDAQLRNQHGLPIHDPSPTTNKISILGTSYQPEVPGNTDFVDSLRRQFSCTLLDCGFVESNPGIINLASRCDGVVIVAEAGRSSHRQIRRAVQVVQLAHGKVLGIVLNKRKYPIPSWLYRIL